jgi:hypothetical protein
VIAREQETEGSAAIEAPIPAVTHAAIEAALSGRADLAALEQQLYGHVVDCIDFDALFGLEQLLWHLVDELGLGGLDDCGDLSKTLIRRAIVRAAHDPSTAITDVPYGITKEEERAAKFDAACPFCRYEDEHPPEGRDAAHDHEDESCPLCDDMARAWREQHADALRRRIKDAPRTA